MYSFRYYYIYDLDFLVDVVSKVSTRFKRLATDYSFWQGLVVIRNPIDPRKAEFVVQECLNSGTREFYMDFMDNLEMLYDLLTCSRYADFINPTKRFPNLKLVRPMDSDMELHWSDDSSQSSDEKESSQ